ncbi:Anaphase-promoting complex subunit 1 [Liparis tanakae]|uniref:Anaphase-promoting complex subunit 1 n=1 Tax=Liparis tanakae TaxID=230148 RepID=A0A4Z2E1I0_9TELE|nr:Anaphase-promoting complex subunit 1 [Liparis tanakae]
MYIYIYIYKYPDYESKSLPCGPSGASGSPLHYGALHGHQSRVMTSSPGSLSRLHSPSISNMAALSRAHSPGMAAPSFSGASRFNTSLHSPSPRAHHGPAPSPRAHHGPAPSPNSTANDTMLPLEMEPIVPDLCMEQLWSEAAGGQRCVKFMESNTTSQLIFTSVTTIAAKDAEPLQVRY